MDNDTNRIYFNRPQLDAIYTGANVTVLAGGRRLGKSVVAAPYLLRNTQHMPRSTIGIVGSTFQQLLTRTLPGTLQALERMGYVRDMHFYIGKRPPEKANFDKPYINPADFSYSLTWYNGTIWRLISQDRAGTSNSLTLDSGLFDEAKLLDFDQLKDETFPAMGGYAAPFINCPWYRSKLIISDMPTTKKGSWFLKYEDDMDEQLIATIQGIVYEKWRIREKMGDKKFEKWPVSMQRYYKSLHKNLQRYRSVAVYYREWSSIENLAVLGEKYIRDMKRDLPPLVFQTSIMSKRVKKLKNGFYPFLDEKKHYYTAFDNSYLDSLDYDLKKAANEDCRQDGDLDLNQAIAIAFDYNANINWLVAGQVAGRKMKVINSFYVKYERKLREVVQDFCEYYRFHRTRSVVYYYDNTALGSNYAVNSDDFASTIRDEFRRNGWKVTMKHIGNPLRHDEKYLLINKAFQGHSDYLMPMFNRNHNEALLLAMSMAGARTGNRGIQKDKTGEKLAESEEDKLEHRTDGTDAFDTLFIGMNKFPYRIGEASDMVSTIL